MFKASTSSMSTSRATNVLRYILKTDKGLNGRISAAGYAETRPKAAQNLKGKAGQELLKNSEVQITKRGIEISLGNTTLFDTAKSDIKPESYEILKEIAIELKNLPNEIVVEGHTDNIVSFKLLTNTSLLLLFL